MPAAAKAGATSATSGCPVLAVATAPATSTTTEATSHGTSNDGVVNSARARPRERNSRPARHSSHPGSRHHTCAATPIHTRPRSTSDGVASRCGRPALLSLIATLPPPPAARAALPAATAAPDTRGSSPCPLALSSDPRPRPPAGPPHTAAATPHGPGFRAAPARRPHHPERLATTPPPPDLPLQAFPPAPRSAPATRRDHAGVATARPAGGRFPTANRPRPLPADILPRPARPPGTSPVARPQHPRQATPRAAGQPATAHAGKTAHAAPRRHRRPGGRSAQPHPSPSLLRQPGDRFTKAANLFRGGPAGHGTPP